MNYLKVWNMKVVQIRQINFDTAPEKIKEQMINYQFYLKCPYCISKVFDWIEGSLNPWMDEYVQEGFYSLNLYSHENIIQAKNKYNFSDIDMVLRKIHPDEKPVDEHILLVRLSNPIEADMFLKQCLAWKLAIKK